MLRRSEWRCSFLWERRRSRRTQRAQVARAAVLDARTSRHAFRLRVSRKAAACPARSSRAERASDIARAAQVRAASVGNRAPAVLRRSEWRCSFLWDDDEVGGPHRAQDRARRCPGRANEQTRFSSASEQGRQRLTQRDPRERSEHQTLREQLKSELRASGIARPPC